MRKLWLNYDEHDFCITTYQSGGEGQGDTQTDIGTYRQKNIYIIDIQTYKNRYHTSNQIGIYPEKNPIVFLIEKVTS